MNYEYVILLACRIRHREALKHPEHRGSGCIATPVGSCATTARYHSGSLQHPMTPVGRFFECHLRRFMAPRRDHSTVYCATAFNAHTHTHTRGESAVTRCIGLLVCRPAEAAAAAAAAAELSSLIIRIPDPWHRRCHSGNVLFISKWYIETIK